MRPGRPQGERESHLSASLAWGARPDEIRIIERGGCGAGLSSAAGRVASAIVPGGHRLAILVLAEAGEAGRPRRRFALADLARTSHVAARQHIKEKCLLPGGSSL